MSKLNTLYICYFWLNESLVQTQVLPYLRELVKGGHRVSLLTFERDVRQNWDDITIHEARKKLAEEGIDWYYLPYHKWPSVPATFYDILNGTRLVNKIVKSKNIEVLHARVHVPALMAALVKTWRRNSLKLLFDIRGFFPEEYVDAGVWKANGVLFRTAKRIERWLFKKSDAFVVLTEKAREVLFPESRENGFDKFGRPVEVIPCCIDPGRFDKFNKISREEMKKELGIVQKMVYIYVGSFGGWYLTDEMVKFFSTAFQRQPNSFIIILTKDKKVLIESKMTSMGIPSENMLISSVPSDEVPKYLGAADVAISFIKECYSKKSSSPTKIAEYLACGVPIISNSGVGDVDKLIEEEKVGVLLRDFDQKSLSASLQEMERMLQDDGLIERCKTTAVEKFDLNTIGGKGYLRVYSCLMAD